MGPQGSNRPIVEIDDPALPRLGGVFEAQFIPDRDKLPMDRRTALFEVHVSPRQSQHLTPSHPSCRSEDERGIERIFSDVGEKRPQLQLVPRATLVPAVTLALRARGLLGRVADEMAGIYSFA
jgi:hypothetical protein